MSAISDKMDEIILRAKRAATLSTGGADGTAYRESFNNEVYKVTLEALMKSELENAFLMIETEAISGLGHLTISMLLRELYDTERDKVDERNFAKGHDFHEWIYHRFPVK